MHLDPAAFNTLLNDLGQAVDWRRAFSCPCRNPQSGGAAPTCPQCHGLGTYWAAPVAARVALSGQKTQREWAQFGQWESGDQVVTLPSDSPAYALGPFDRLTMRDSSVPFTVILGAGEPLRGAILSVHSVTWWHDGHLMTAPVLPVVGLDGVLLWPGDAPPAAPLAISGRKHPEYFVFQDGPQDRSHHGGASLPRRVVLRLFDLFGRG
jgi:hypothetical protein